MERTTQFRCWRTRQFFLFSFIFLYACLCITPIKAQTFQVLYGDANTQGMQHLVQPTPNGDYFVIGNVSNVGPVMSRIDRWGNVLWTKQFIPPIGFVSFQHAVVMDDGSILIAARWLPSATATLGNKLYLIKVDQNGVVLQTSLYSGATNGRILDIKVVRTLNDQYGETYVVKHWNSPDGSSSDNMRVIKINNYLQVLWARDFDYAGGSDDQPQAMCATNNGGVAIAGTIGGFGFQAYVTLINFTGIQQLSRHYDTNVNLPYNMIATRSVTGAIDGFVMVSESRFSSHSNGQIWKVDATTLLPVWSRRISATQDVYLPLGLVEETNGFLNVSYSVKAGSSRQMIISRFASNGAYSDSYNMGFTSRTNGAPLFNLVGAGAVALGMIDSKMPAFVGFGAIDAFVGTYKTLWKTNDCYPDKYKPKVASFDMAQALFQWDTARVELGRDTMSLPVADQSYCALHVCGPDLQAPITPLRSQPDENLIAPEELAPSALQPVEKQTITRPMSTARIFPNPAKDQITVYLDLTESQFDSPLEIVDMYGAIVKTASPKGAEQLEISLEGLPAGMYILSRDGRALGWFVKE